MSASEGSKRRQLPSSQTELSQSKENKQAKELSSEFMGFIDYIAGVDESLIPKGLDPKGRSFDGKGAHGPVAEPEPPSGDAILSQCSLLIAKVNEVIRSHHLLLRDVSCGAQISNVVLIMEIWRGEVHLDYLESSTPTPLQQAKPDMLDFLSGAFMLALRHVYEIEKELASGPNPPVITSSIEVSAENLENLCISISRMREIILLPTMAIYQDELPARSVDEPESMKVIGDDGDVEKDRPDKDRPGFQTNLGMKDAKRIEDEEDLEGSLAGGDQKLNE